MATIGISRASKLLKISALATRAFSFVGPPIPRMMDEQEISERMKKLFPQSPENFTLEEKKPLSIGEEEVNQEMEKLYQSYMNERFDDRKADTEMAQEWNNYYTKSFTLNLNDGRVLSVANVYKVESAKDVHRRDKRKLVERIAYEVDEEGNIIKSYDGDLMLFDEHGYI